MNAVPRRRRSWATLLVTVLLLVGLLVAADRLALWLAERSAERGLVAVVDDVEGDARVRIAGFPFLSQLLTGLGEVEVTAAGVVVEGYRFADVEVVLHDVALGSPRTAGQVSADGLLAPEEVLDDLGGRLSYREDGGALVVTTSVLGAELAMSLVPSVDDGDLDVTVEEVRLGGVSVTVSALPDAVAQRLQDIDVALEALPAGLVVTGVHVVDAGFRVQVEGRDVVLERR